MLKKKRIISLMLAFAVILTLVPTTGLTPVYAAGNKITMYPKDTEQLAYKKGNKYKSSNTKVATVTKSGIVKAKKKGSAKVTITSGKKKTVKNITVKAAPAVTRGTWIKNLVEKSEIGISENDCHYSDVNRTYAKSVQTAYEQGAIPGDEKYFHPYRPATREFVAYSAVHLLGFQTDSTATVSCTDSSKLKYKGEDTVALNQGFVSLKNKKFKPAAAISKKDSNTALKTVTAIVDATKVDSNHENKVVLRDDVNDSLLDSGTSYSVTDSGNELTAVIPNSVGSVSTGQVVFVPQSDGSVTPIKVTEATESNGEISVKGTTPDISDIYKDIDIQAEETADLSGFKANDNIVSSVAPVQSGMSGKSQKVEISLNDTFTVGQDIVKDKTFNVGEAGSFTPKVTLTAPEITTIVDIGNPIVLSDYHELSVTVSDKVIAETNFKINENLGAKTKFELGSLEYQLKKYPLFTVLITFYLDFSVSGSATVKCTIANKAGVAYRNGDLRFIGESDASIEGTEAEIDGHLYFEPYVDLTLNPYYSVRKTMGENFVKINGLTPTKIVGVKAEIGPSLKTVTKRHDTAPLKCVDVHIWLHLSAGLNTDDGIGKLIKGSSLLGKLPTTKTFFDDNDQNPLRLNWHYEDDKRTADDKCTWEEKSQQQEDDDDTGEDVNPDYYNYEKDITYEFIGTVGRYSYILVTNNSDETLFVMSRFNGIRSDGTTTVGEGTLEFVKSREQQVMSIMDSTSGNLDDENVTWDLLNVKTEAHKAEDYWNMHGLKNVNAKWLSLAESLSVDASLVGDYASSQEPVKIVIKNITDKKIGIEVPSSVCKVIAKDKQNNVVGVCWLGEIIPPLTSGEEYTCTTEVSMKTTPDIQYYRDIDHIEVYYGSGHVRIED